MRRLAVSAADDAKQAVAKPADGAVSLVAPASSSRRGDVDAGSPAPAWGFVAAAMPAIGSAVASGMRRAPSATG